MLAEWNASAKKAMCKECRKSFRGKYELNRHNLAKHSSKEERAALMIKCPKDGCIFSSIQKTNVTTHYRAVHLRLKEHICDLSPNCTEAFGDPSSLSRHKKAVHGFRRGGKSFRPVDGKRRHRVLPKFSSEDDLLRCVSPVSDCWSPISLSFSSSDESSSSYPTTPTEDMSPIAFFPPSQPSPVSLEQFPTYLGTTAYDPNLYFQQFGPSVYGNLFSMPGSAPPEFLQGCSALPALPFSNNIMPSEQSLYVTSYGATPYAAQFSSCPSTSWNEGWNNMFAVPMSANPHSLMVPSMPMAPVSDTPSNLGFLHSMDSLPNAPTNTLPVDTNLDFDKVLREMGLDCPQSQL